MEKFLINLAFWASIAIILSAVLLVGEGAPINFNEVEQSDALD